MLFLLYAVAVTSSSLTYPALINAKLFFSKVPVVVANTFSISNSNGLIKISVLLV